VRRYGTSGDSDSIKSKNSEVLEKKKAVLEKTLFALEIIYLGWIKFLVGQKVRSNSSKNSKKKKQVEKGVFEECKK
jgi:hypothetical protein